MITRFIFATSLVLLCFSIVSGIFLFWLLFSPKPALEMIPLPQPVRTCQCSGGGEIIGTISGQSSSILAIVGELPRQMDDSTSETIQVKLTFSIPSSGEPENHTSSNTNRSILQSGISKRLDNDVDNYCTRHDSSGQNFSNCLSNPPPMKELFDPGYELFASAHLIATSFDVELLDATEQSADQTSIEWDWNIFPKSTGNQPINLCQPINLQQCIEQPISLNIDLHWKSINNNKDIFRQIWEDNPTIIVKQPLFTLGQITISTVVSAFTALIFAGVSGPTILGGLKKWRGAKPRERLEQELKQEQEERERLEQELKQEQEEREQLEQEQLKRKQLKRKQLNWEQSRRERFRHL